ncbi:hypothetical protein RCK40_24485, partial [Salmonella enterica subsp. enterica serovar 1,4,[5],12:i:-]
RKVEAQLGGVEVPSTEVAISMPEVMQAVELDSAGDMVMADTAAVAAAASEEVLGGFGEGGNGLHLDIDATLAAGAGPGFEDVLGSADDD